MTVSPQPPTQDMAQWLAQTQGVAPGDEAETTPLEESPEERGFTPELPDDNNVPHPLQITKRRRSPGKPLHLWEQAAEEVIQWIDEMTDDVADALMFEGRSPFAADLNEAEKLEFYRDTMKTAEGRNALMQRVGVDGYVNIISALAESAPGSLPPASKDQSRRDREARGY